MIGIQQALETLRSSNQVGYVLDPGLNLVFRNPAWDHFARENGAPELAADSIIGTNLQNVIDDSLWTFYLEAFNKVTKEQRVWELVYECSSPELFRKFLMRVHPIEPDGWLLLTHNILVEREHTPSEHGPIEHYLDDRGQIRMCVHCRCSKRVTLPDSWDFVPGHLDRTLGNVTHGLCPICKSYFYPSGTV